MREEGCGVCDFCGHRCVYLRIGERCPVCSVEVTS